jgi:hypothetical protein
MEASVLVSILAYFATVCSGIFAGAALYVSLVEHPARLSCGNSVALAEFGPSYRRGAIMQAGLASLASIFGIWIWIANRQIAWILGALPLLFIILFTLVVIFPVNKKLLDPSLDPNSQTARHLLKTWGHLHLVRSVAGLASFLVFLSESL